MPAKSLAHHMMVMVSPVLWFWLVLDIFFLRCLFLLLEFRDLVLSRHLELSEMLFASVNQGLEAFESFVEGVE